MKIPMTIATAFVLFLLTGEATAQTEARSPALFDSRNAIIDTAIPFAIGAQEAQQSLRGSFGWQTFQEGLVEGVYYRFDPDGYARFAPTPRLDQDQFEVVCVPRSFVCTGQKGELHLALNQRGQLQIQLENLGAADQFFLFDGTNELPLPTRILEPLDIRLESLLMSGGELLIKRNGQAVSNISLTGFSAVTAYIRWVAAGQDYSVLPRNWPIPNSATSAINPSITQPDTWTRPSAATQSVVPWPNTNVPVGSRAVGVQEPYDPTRPLTRILAQDTGVQQQPQQGIAALQAEIDRLRLNLGSPQPATSLARSAFDPPAAPGASDLALETALLRLTEILHRHETILIRMEQLEMRSLQTAAMAAPVNNTGATTLSVMPLAAGQEVAPMTAVNPFLHPSTPIDVTAGAATAAPMAPVQQATSLEAEILKAINKLANAGLIGEVKPPVPMAAPLEHVFAPSQATLADSAVVLERSVVEQILAELDASSPVIPVTTPLAEILPQQLKTLIAEPTEDPAKGYKSLSEYFESATK